jgi:sec-independent protein translocase protein TatB
MFDIGGGEFLVIAIVALIAIGPKELPGVLRMVGQWVGKARSMARDFQGQFQEAMREADIAEMKKQFDEAADKASSYSPTNLLENINKDVNDAVMKPIASTDGNVSETAAAETNAIETKPFETTAIETKPADTDAGIETKTEAVAKPS